MSASTESEPLIPHIGVSFRSREGHHCTTRGSPRKKSMAMANHRHRTPAMAAKPTEHPWSVMELPRP
ncbi:MAG: hypothetical protein HQL57_07875 [Magnetococcales bacterium]|nr:hypothetical protein [Magnetococcales bacterium]MBF0157084.1 hypothetical protein [Magnetococcales bacterium]